MNAVIRFACAYAVLYLFPFPLSAVVPSLPYRAWRPITEAVGGAVGRWLGIATPTPAYVGDAMVHHLYLGVAAVVAMAIALVWGRLERDSGLTQRADRWLRSYLRLALAYFLINYGSIKVVPYQFPELGLDTLYQPIGDVSKMGLLWAFMGASPFYAAISGAIEVVAGVLLVFRRTAMAGALLALFVLTQVSVLNVAYQVPAKQFTVHLWLMAAYLLAADARRLWAALLGHAVSAARRSELFAAPRFNRAASWLGVGFLIYVLSFAAVNATRNERATGASAPRSPLHGVWHVEGYSAEGATTEQRWRRIIFDGPEWVGLQLADESYVRVRAAFEDDGAFMTLSLEEGGNEATVIAALRVNCSAPAACTLDGTVNNKPARMQLARVEARAFELMRRPFRWIAEAELIR
jgi:hypothetical protein